MSSYIKVTDSIDSWVRFTMPYPGVVTWQFECRTTDASGGVGASAFFNNNMWRVAWDETTSTNLRMTNFTVDGSSLSGITTRTQLASFVCNGEWRTFKYVNHARASADNGTMWLEGDVIELASYRFNSANSQIADLRNFKVDIGNTGSWTHESALGDTNGFTRNNVTVIQSETRRRRHAGGYGL